MLPQTCLKAPRTPPAGAPFSVFVLVLLTVLAGGPAARAHDLWIAASSFRPAPDEAVRVYLRLGEHGGIVEPVGRDSRRIERFDVVGPDGTRPLPGLDGRELAGVFRAKAAGRHAVVYVSRPSLIELAPEVFGSYLREEGLEPILEERRELGEAAFPARELYARSLKALIDVGEDGMSDEPVGLPLELVLEWESSEEEAGPERRARGVRLLWDGQPLAGALVRARRTDARESVVTGRTDRTGRARFTFGPGRWIVSTVTMERSDDERAEWESTWTSLTFEIPDPR